MAIYSKFYFEELAEKSQTVFRKQLNESAKLEKFDIFLSHSYLDRKIIEGIFIELTSHGFSVYVDWLIDPHLDRSNVTKQSAELIRNRMKSCKSLLLAISTNAKTSKWMPWELGFVDGNTGSKCAILPISELRNPEDNYQGFEYLKLYPYVKEGQISNYQNRELYVLTDNITYVSLRDFVRLGYKPTLKSILL